VIWGAYAFRVLVSRRAETNFCFARFGLELSR